MRRFTGTAAVVLSMAWLVSGSAAVAAAALPRADNPAPPAPAAKKRVDSVADLPRFTYRIDGPVEDIVRDDAKFAAFAQALRRDTESVLAGYEIGDKATRRDLLNLLATLDLLDGRLDDALRHADEVRALLDKPAAKLLSGIAMRAMIAAQRETGSPAGDAYTAALAHQLATTLDPLPYAVVANDVKGNKASAEIIGEALVLGNVRETLQPVADKSGSLSSELVPGIVRARYGLTRVLPLKAVLTEAYSSYLASHRVEKPDIWAARAAPALPGVKLAPVVVGIWDSGVDTSLFPAQRLTDAKGRPVVIGYDLDGRRDDHELQALPAAARADLGGGMAQLAGFSDLQANVDSPAASEVKKMLGALSPEQFRPRFEGLGLVANYSHGTHVAGIALADNPTARLVVGRIQFEYKFHPDPCPSLALTRRNAAAAGEVVAFFERHHVKVVNMSWGGTADEDERAMEQCGIGKTPAERKQLAERYLAINKHALSEAMRKAPDILFVAAAGNSDQDASFTDDIPAGLKLPNLVAVGAVDKAGDEAPFTSYGPTVLLHANGFEVESVLPGGKRVALSGTSMAAPQVTNLAARMLAVNPALRPTQLIALMRETADRSEDGRRVLIHPGRAVQAALDARTPRR